MPEPAEKCIAMVDNFQANFFPLNLLSLLNDYSWCFSKRGNLQNLVFLQNHVYNIDRRGQHLNFASWEALYIVITYSRIMLPFCWLLETFQKYLVTFLPDR